MSAPFAPKSADAIADWARENHTTPEIARRRFIQAASLYIIAGDTELRSVIRVFGSAVLSILHGTKRTSADLDLWCRPQMVPNEASKNQVHLRLNQALNQGLRQFVPFDDHWRPLLAKEIKIQLCSDEALEVDFEQVSLDFDRPRSIWAYSMPAALALKLLAVLSPLIPGRPTPRDRDIYDIADAVVHLDANPDQILRAALRSPDSRTMVINEKTVETLRQMRQLYQTKHASGEFDISWEKAWPIYSALLGKLVALPNVESLG